MLISTLVSISNVFSQSRKLERAIEKYELEFYDEAIPLLKDLIKNDKNAYTPLKYLASSYRKVKDYQNAELYFTLVVNSDSAQAEDYLYYGQALKSNGKLAAAKEQFVKFKETTESSFLGKLMLQSIDQINAWESQPKSYRSIKMDNLNTPSNEYGALIYRDKIYITSDREASLTSTESYSWNNQPFLSIYSADTSMLDSAVAEFQEVPGLLNTPYHDGPLTVDPINKTVMITRVDNQGGGKKFINRMKMYEGSFASGKWKTFKAFPFNSNKYSVGHAHYVDSGRTVYFASDMPGGYGGFDLYVCHREEDGRWSMPKNLGAVVNTSKNEVFPFLKGDELYFSSNGFPGYGELDIIVSKRTEEGWQAPLNLKSPINSNRDDFGIYFYNDTMGFYSSNREGGAGLDDIYKFIKYGDNIEISGVFEFKGLPVQGTKVILTDANDSIIAETYTDADGNFIFKNLTYSEDYVLQIESDDPEIMDEGRLYITDEEGEKIKFIERMKSGGFTFKALPKDEIREVEAIRAADEVVLNELKFVGQVFEELPGDIEEEVTVYLMDSQGEVIDSTVTEEGGLFTFNRLPRNEEYSIKLKDASDEDMSIAFLNDQERVYNVEKMDDEGIISFEPTIDASKLLEMAKDRGFTTLIARLENKGAPVTNTIIEIYDKDQNLITTVITNEEGEFQYNNLEFDRHYFIKIPSMDVEMLNDAMLYVIREDGTALYLIHLLESGLFEFNSLPFDEYDKQQVNERRLVPEEVSLAGKLLPAQEEDIVEGLEVYLIGEDGRIVDTVKTDENGKFKFEKLNPEENYTFRVSGGAGDVALALLDEDNRIVEKAVVKDDGSFSYQKLTYQIAQFVPISIDEADMIEEQFDHEVSAQIFRKLPGDIGPGMKIFLYDENGILIKTAVTDATGNFTFERLSEDQNYVFKIDGAGDDFTMITFDENHKVVETKIRKQGKEFSYSPLGFIENTLDESDADELDLVAYDEDGTTALTQTVKKPTTKPSKKPVETVKGPVEQAKKTQPIAYKGKVNSDGKFIVYYNYNESELSAEAREKLNQFVMLFAEDEFLIEISSHTDQRGSEAFNMALSKRRTESVSNYLEQNGIDAARLRGRWFGEQRLVIDCDKEDCDHEDHAKNRRSEIDILE